MAVWGVRLGGTSSGKMCADSGMTFGRASSQVCTVLSAF